MDLDFSAEEREFRRRAREWLAAHVPVAPLPSLETEAGFAAHRAWERVLAADRWSVVSWPEEFGGQGVDLVRWLLFEEEYHAAGAPGRVSQNGINLLAPTLFGHGTAEQRARVLPPMATGEVIWAQAWSEPEAGSDLASLRSTARRTEGGWLIGGQKAWSSRAAFADRAFGLFRCEPYEAAGRARGDGPPKPHQGLVYLMFPLDADGVTVRPVGRLDGKPAFAELFLDDVFVPDEDIIGEPGQGWRIAMSTTGDERGLTLRSPGRFLATADRLARCWRDRSDPADTALRDQVADAVIGARAYELFTWASASRFAAGETAGADSSLNKVFWSEHDIAVHETALDLLGPEGELTDGADDETARGDVAEAGGPRGSGPGPDGGTTNSGTGPDGDTTGSGPGPDGDQVDGGAFGRGRAVASVPPRSAYDWVEGYVFSLAGTIYAGTNEIQRDIIAERLLGLPKGRR